MQGRAQSCPQQENNSESNSLWGMNPFTFCYLFASSSYEAGAVPGASRGDEDTWGPCPLDPNAERGHEISKEEESLPLNVPRSCRGPPRRKVAWGPGPHC